MSRAQIAEFERELIRERVLAGMADAKKRGCTWADGIPYDPAEELKRRLHLEEGKSLGQIAALLGCGRTASAMLRAAQRNAAYARLDASQNAA